MKKEEQFTSLVGEIPWIQLCERARCRDVSMLPVYYAEMAEIHFMCAYVYLQWHYAHGEKHTRSC